nr:hypothetical protein [Nakamurella leprariae]
MSTRSMPGDSDGSSSRSTARRPSSKWGIAALVSPGRSHPARSESSKEITERSSGMDNLASAAAWYAPRAIRSFRQISAVGRWPSAKYRLTAAWAGSGHQMVSMRSVSSSPWGGEHVVDPGQSFRRGHGVRRRFPDQGDPAVAVVDQDAGHRASGLSFGGHHRRQGAAGAHAVEQHDGVLPQHLADGRPACVHRRVDEALHATVGHAVHQRPLHRDGPLALADEQLVPVQHGGGQRAAHDVARERLRGDDVRQQPDGVRPAGPQPTGHQVRPVVHLAGGVPDALLGRRGDAHVAASGQHVRRRGLGDARPFGDVPEPDPRRRGRSAW